MTLQFVEPKTIDVKGFCLFCRKESVVTVLVSGWATWKVTGRIDVAFPDLSLDDRETLISGSHGACFDAAYADDEDDEDDDIDLDWEG